MGLTQEQIAFEKDWARRYGDAATSMEFEKWAAFLKDTTSITRPGMSTFTGKAAIEHAHANLKKFATSWKYTNLKTTVDEENGRVILTCNSSSVLNGDPEKKELRFREAIIVHKALGQGEELIDSEESITDPSVFIKRMMELGMNPDDLKK